MNKQSGSAIFIILIAVALFAALGFAFMQGSRTSTSWLEQESSKAQQTDSQAYQLVVQSAVKRLKLKGCKDSEISYETPNGNDENPLAPSTERCHVFRVAGGGVQFKGADAANDPCSSGPAGSACLDGSVYIGMSAGGRIYAGNSNTGANITWGGNGFSIATSLNDGVANTDFLLTEPNGQTYPPAQACRALGPKWFLPSKDELYMLWTMSALNGGSLDVTTLGISTSGHWYWASSQNNATGAWRQRFSTGSQSADNKTASYRYHCFRTD